MKISIDKPNFAKSSLGEAKKGGNKKKKSEIKNKKEKKEVEKVNSQLRQDLVSGDWVVIAAGRGKRPDDFRNGEQEQEVENDGKECLFCDPEATGQEKDTLIYTKEDGDWSLRVFPNKYPIFSRPSGGKIAHKDEGPFFWMEGVGYHEVIVTRDHEKHIGQMNPIFVAELLDAYQTRYLDLMNKKSVRLIEIFHNHGKRAGASIEHPHSQLVAMPVISPYINLELNGAESYHQANKECVFCNMISWEQEKKERIVFENEQFVAFCPFASRAAFEVWVMPKKHQPYFERITDEEKFAGGEALHEAIKKISEVIEGVEFNFYLHTSPCDGKDYPHYHWHMEILPRTANWAGLELSTGVEVCVMEPERAAEYLRGK